MFVGWLDPHSITKTDNGARIKAALLNDAGNCELIDIDIETRQKALDVADAFRRQAQYGITDLDGSLRVVDTMGSVEVQPDGSVRGSITVDGSLLRLAGLLQLEGDDALPPGEHDGQFCLVGRPSQDQLGPCFRVYRMAAEIEPAPSLDY